MNFDINFLENVNPFQKMEQPFLVESTEIENAHFSYKTALSEANVRKVEWGVQNGPITKEQSFFR